MTLIVYNVTDLRYEGFLKKCKNKQLIIVRVDPNYMYYYIHWTRLLTTGIIPFMYLFYMNMRIYCR